MLHTSNVSSQDLSEDLFNGNKHRANLANRMKYSIHDRSSPSYPYLSRGQPFTAIFGLVACLLIVFFNGWQTFYRKPFKVENFLASYLWVSALLVVASALDLALIFDWVLQVIIFVCIYTIHKVVQKSKITPLRDLDYYSFLGAREEPAPPSKGRLRNLVEFERPVPKARSRAQSRGRSTVSMRSDV